MKRIVCILLAVISILPAVLAGGCSKEDPNIKIKPSWDDFTPQEGARIARDPGYTLDNWDLSKAKNYPFDENCTPEEFFQKWMDVEGLTTQDLDDRGCRQLVISAQSDLWEYETTLTCYEKNKNGEWVAVSGLTKLRGTNGRRGVNHDRVQGDETSPGGIWQLGTVFGNEKKPKGLKMPWRSITPNSVWIGVQSSKYYNTWQEIDKVKDEHFTNNSGEHLQDYTTSYALSCVIRFNMPPYTDSRKGAAIFFHVSNGGTAGCIGLPYNDFKRCILWLNPDCNPYILITGYGK